MTATATSSASSAGVQRAPRCKSGSDKVQDGWEGWEPSEHTAGKWPHACHPLECAHGLPRLICHVCPTDPPLTTQGSVAAWQSGVAGGSKKTSHHHYHLSLVAITHTLPVSNWMPWKFRIIKSSPRLFLFPPLIHFP